MGDSIGYDSSDVWGANGSGDTTDLGSTNYQFSLDGSESYQPDNAAPGGSSVPGDTGTTNFWKQVSSGALDIANLGLGVYKTVNQVQNQQNQPERLPDGRLVQNIQGKPTVLTTDKSSQYLQLIIIVAIIFGAVELAKKA